MKAVRDALSDFLKNQLTQWLLTPIVAAVVLWFSATLLPALRTETGSKVAASLIGISTSLALVAALNLRRLSATKRLRPRFGIYWDDQLEPHCPTCKSLLHSYA